MFLLVLLLILSVDILFLKMLMSGKKDEKEYFYKTNTEFVNNIKENNEYKCTVYFNSEFIPNILIKEYDEIVSYPTGPNINEYQKVDFSKEDVIRRNNCKISLNNGPHFKKYKYKIDFYFVLKKSGKYMYYDVCVLLKSENNEDLDSFIICYSV